MAKSQSVKKNVVYNFVYQILILIIPLVTTPYLSRVLGADGIGEYAYNYSIATYFVLFAMLGLSNYGNRTIASVRDDKEKLSQKFSSIYCIQCITSAIALIGYLLFALFFRREKMMFIMFFYVLSSAFDISWFFFGIEQFKLTITRNVIIKLISIVSIFLFVKEFTDVYLYGIIMTVSMLISQLSIWPFVNRFTNFQKPSWQEIICHLKPNLVLFVPVIAISLYKTMDKIMLGAMASQIDVGYYENAEKIIGIPIAFIQSLGTVMLPKMSNLVANNKEGESRKYIYLSLLFAAFLSTSLSFGIMGVSKEFVPLFYGKGFDECIELFLILSPSTIFMALANVIRTQYLIPMHKDRIYIMSVFLGAGTNIIINSLLIPIWGASGAAYGTLVAEGGVCIYQMVKVRKMVSLRRPIFRSIPFLGAGMLMFIILYNIELNMASSILNLVVKVLIGALVYIAAVIIVYGLRRYMLKYPSILNEN